jgi:tetratricopeptide (TPR) repeat protein
MHLGFTPSTPLESAFNRTRILPVLLILTLGVPLFSQADAYQDALASYRSGRYLEALVALQKAIGQEKDNAPYHLLHARILAALRQFGDAEESLGRAIELQPQWVEPYYELGVLLFRRGKYREAATTLAKGVEFAPDSVKTRFLLGVSYMQINLDGAAMEQFKAVEAADPRYPAVHHSIGRVYFRQGRDTEAIEHFRTELAHNPDHHAARFLLGKALVRLGEAEEAVVHLRTLQGKEVGQAQLHYFLGAAYRRLGKRAEALEALLKSIALNPASYESRYLLARLYLDTGQPDLARKQMSMFEQLRQREGRGRPVDPKKFDREDQEFVQADSDSNGQLTPSEFEGFVNTRVKGFARHDEFFQGLDGNADGFLDRQEFSRRFELLGKLQRQ